MSEDDREQAYAASLARAKFATPDQPTLSAPDEEAIDRLRRYLDFCTRNDFHDNDMIFGIVKIGDFRTLLNSLSRPKGEEIVERVAFRPLYTAKRKFTNSVGNSIEIYVSTGKIEQTLCKISMFGPDSGCENYSTWDELVQLHHALSETLGVAALGSCSLYEEGGSK